MSENAEPALAGLLAAVKGGHTILAPNTELAAALYDAIERAYRAAGLDIWATPRVRDFGGWLRDEHVRAQLTDSTSPRLLSDIEERELWRTLIEAGDSGRDFHDPAAAARAARRARRTMYEYGIPQRSVAERGAGSDETEAFLEWNRQFDERCRDRHWIGADELLGRAGPAASPLTWIESPAWRPMARQWLERHGQRLPPPFDVSRRTSVLHAASPIAEFAAIAEWARVNLRAQQGFRAWVCVPDLGQRREEIVDAMDAALMPQRFSLAVADAPAPYAVAGGTALERYAPVHAALRILTRARGRSPSSRSACCCEHPSGRSRRPPPARLRWSMCCCEPEAPARRILHPGSRSRKNSRARWAPRHSPPCSACVARSRNSKDRAALILESLGPRLGARVRSGSVGAAAALVEHGVSGSGTIPRTAGPVGRRGRVLRHAIARRGAAHLAPRGARHGVSVKTGVPAVWVSGQLIDPWLNYDGIWVSGCSDDKWPPAAQPIPFLPGRLQREYSVIGAASESQLQAALELQSRWAARAALCVFSYPDTRDGRPGSPSRLLPAAQELSSVPQPHWHALLQAAAPLERLTDEHAPPFGAGERTRGVSTLKAQSRCAFAVSRRRG